MASPPVTHPPIEFLQAYNLGTLDDTKVGAMETHLEQCTACREQVEAMSGENLDRGLRRADDPHSTVAPAQPLPAGDRGQAGITASFPGATPIPDLPPELTNHPQYEVLRKLGAGGMGVVYLARHRLSGREEVLKVMNKALLNEPENKDRFLREIRSVAMLDHPNVVKMHTALELGELTVLVMEYGDAESLADMVKARETLMPVLNACYYIQQAALGLQHAFDKKMVHRDIKPHNLIVSRQGKKHVVKVLDFGLAKVKSEKGESLALTATGQPLGTFAYMAPEQALDSAHADIRADIYSLGCTLYQLIAGTLPFPGQSVVQMIYAHQSLEPEPLDMLRPDVPKALALIVNKMMAKDPAQRYQTPAEVAQVLKAFVKQEQERATGGSSDDLSRGSTGVRAQAAPDKSSGHARELKSKKKPASAPNLQYDAFDFGREPAGRQGTNSIDSRKRATRPAGPSSARKKRWLIGGAVATCVLLIGLVGLWAGGVFKVKTKEGIIVLEVNEPNAEVYVDGEKVRVTWGDGGRRAEIGVKSGTRKVEIKKDGFTAYGDEVGLEEGGRKLLTARLEQLPKAALPQDPKIEQGMWVITGSGLKYEDLKEGTGAAAKKDDTVEVHYTGWLKDGTKFDSSLDRGKPFSFQLGAPRGVIKGWNEGVQGMKLGGKRKLIIPSELAYGHGEIKQGGKVVIPGNSELTFEIELLEIKGVPMSKPDEQGSVQLFNGKDLTGWYVESGDARQWAVEGEAIVGRSAGFGTHNYLLSSREYSDFTLHFEFMVDPGSNGGLALRAIENERLPASNAVLIAEHPIIKLTDSAKFRNFPLGTTTWLKDNTADKPSEVPKLPTGSWHPMVITVRGDTCVATIGPEQIVNIKLDPDPSASGGIVPALKRTKGKIGFQAHTGTVRFRKIEIKELIGSEAAVSVQAPHVLGAWVGTRPGQERDDNGLKMKLCWCPAGTFTMGSAAGEPERVDTEGQVDVTLTHGFWMGKYVVTQSEYEKIMGTNPSCFSASGSGKFNVAGMDTSRFPVEQVSWEEATEFCHKLTAQERQAGRLPAGWEYRLPTEAQWEYACRAGTKTATAFGDKLSSREANFDGNYPYNGAEKGPNLARTSAVGSYPANAWGLHDMHGNVWQRCRDWHNKLSGGSDPEGRSAAGTRRISGARAMGFAWPQFSLPAEPSIELGQLPVESDLSRKQIHFFLTESVSRLLAKPGSPSAVSDQQSSGQNRPPFARTSGS